MSCCLYSLFLMLMTNESLTNCKSGAFDSSPWQPLSSSSISIFRTKGFSKGFTLRPLNFFFCVGCPSFNLCVLWIVFACVAKALSALNTCLHTTHAYLSCISLVCLCKSYFHLNIFLQKTHSSLSVWVFKWVLKYFFNIKHFPHFWHWNVFSLSCLFSPSAPFLLSPKWMAWWLIRTYFVLKLASHFEHWCGRTSECVCIWTLRLSFLIKSFSQREHLNSFSPICILRWAFKLCFDLKDALHIGQIYGLSVEWHCMWAERDFFVTKVLEQVAHWKDLLLLWLLKKWYFKLVFELKPLPQSRQWKGLKFEWITMWFLRLSFRVNPFPHKVHWKRPVCVLKCSFKLCSESNVLVHTEQ